MNVALKIPDRLFEAMLADIQRPHEFAYERIGFMYCKQSVSARRILLLAYCYKPIKDDQYIPAEDVGARFDSSAIREAMQFALTEVASTFHVHLHDHTGVPRLSNTDKAEMQKLMPCFVNLLPDLVHGALILSQDSATARCWSAEHTEGHRVDTITRVGPRMRFFRQGK